MTATTTATLVMRDGCSLHRRSDWHLLHSAAGSRFLALVCLGYIMLSVVEANTPYWSRLSGGDQVQTDNDDLDPFQSTLVSPIVNREVQVSVKAPWPTSSQHNVLCEAYAFISYSSDDEDDKGASYDDNDHHDVAPQYRFLDALTASHGRDHLHTFEKATNYALDLWEQASSGDIDDECEASSSPLSSSSLSSDLLKVALAMRAMSPTCELHRTFAAERYADQVEFLEAFAVAASPRPIGDGTNLPESVFETSADLPESAIDLPVLTKKERKAVLFPHEMIRRDSVSDSDAFGFVILYARLGGHSFATFYQRLVELKIPFVVRHVGSINNTGGSNDGEFGDKSLEEEEVDIPDTVLQGYGVRLDIRNVEYKVFDDRGSESGDEREQSGLFDLSNLDAERDVPHTHTHFLAGVNLTALGLDKDLSEEDGGDSSLPSSSDLERELWKRHDGYEKQHQLIPPNWQRRKLSLQAATVIAKSVHPLLTLQDVSQNLPSLASTLVHIDVPAEVVDIAEPMENSLQHLMRSSGGGLWVNGRTMNVARPSFNVFEMIDLLQKEERALKKLERRLRPLFLKGDQDSAAGWTALKKIQQAWIQGESFFVPSRGNSLEDDEYFDDEDDEDMDDSGDGTSSYRIDLATGDDAVVYMNDLEKDRAYERLTTSVQQMLMAMQYGMPPSVRRNLFTILVVDDPIEYDQNIGLSLMAQLAQQQFPARLATIVVSQDDIDECTQWVRDTKADAGQPCPLKAKSWFDGDDAPSSKELADTKLSTRDVHRLLAYMRDQFADRSEALAPYQIYLGPSIQQNPPINGEFYSLKDLFTIHNELLVGLQLAPSKMPLELIANELMENEEESKYSYAKAVRFAVDKGVKTGMSFVNGRPLPDSSDEGGSDVQKIFMEEQQMVFKMIMKQQITDDKPRNFYYKLIKGKKKNVFPRLHPLLTSGSESETLVEIQHSFTTASLLTPNSMQAVSPTDAEAIILFEAALELDTLKGLSFARDFLRLMNELPETVSGTQIAAKYRVIPSTKSAASSRVCKVLASAGAMGFKTTLETIERLVDNPEYKIDESKFEALASSPCSDVSYLKDDMPSTNFISGNGRIYIMGDANLDPIDFELLLSVNLDPSKSVTALLNDYIGTDQGYDAISRTTAFLLAAKASGDSRSSPDLVVDQMQVKLDVENVLRFAWNTGERGDGLKMAVIAIVDPVTETAQRLSPLLLLMRDELKLPLSLILAPRTQLDSDSDVPISSYYRFVADAAAYQRHSGGPVAHFSNLPSNHVLTLRMDVPEPWDVQQTLAIQDTDNLRCDVTAGCGDDSSGDTSLHLQRHVTSVEYGLEHLLFFGQCYETNGSPPNGLQLLLSHQLPLQEKSASKTVEVQPDGSVLTDEDGTDDVSFDKGVYSDTLVMKTVGYWQLRANPGTWDLRINEESRGAEIFRMVEGKIRNGMVKVTNVIPNERKQLIISDFLGRGEMLLVKRKPGFEKASLFFDDKKGTPTEEEVVHVFSLATGHLYERFLKIMMLSVTKRTSTRVKFWLFENFLSPTFKASSIAMAKQIGCEVEFVTYKWPEWLRGQSEKQRIIWGYKILFLDVLFPLNVKKIIYVDADQVVRGDLKELWDMDLNGAPYGYTPMCSSNESTLGFQFWRHGFWETHLRGRPYHISALYVVDLEKFRKDRVGDTLRAQYQQLSADPNSLANLDQDLPNYAQHQVPIFSLPQEWLWCESWCSLETKPLAKTIDLCNNPLHKEPKVSMAKRIISGELFQESWIDLNAMVEKLEEEYIAESSLEPTKPSG